MGLKCKWHLTWPRRILRKSQPRKIWRPWQILTFMSKCLPLNRTKSSQLLLCEFYNRIILFASPQVLRKEEVIWFTLEEAIFITALISFGEIIQSWGFFYLCMLKVYERKLRIHQFSSLRISLYYYFSKRYWLFEFFVFFCY